MWNPPVKRSVLIGMLCIGGSMLAGVLYSHFFYGFPIDADFIGAFLLMMLVLLNVLYLFFTLNRTSVTAAIIFMCAYMALSYGFHKIYPQSDFRVGLLYILAVLVAMTVVIHLLRHRGRFR